MTGGHYLVIEGLEGAGKTTVAGRLAAWLEERGESVVAVREPGGTEAGERIREILLDPESRISAWAEALLFAAARAELATEVVGPALREGRWVVGDRSVYSSLAYQGMGRGLGIEAVRKVNEAGLGGVWPELVVLLTVDPDNGLARQQVADRFGGEKSDFWRRVTDAFEELAAAEPDRFLVVEGGRPLDEAVDEVLKMVGSRWPV
jgi:dTMP kinase